MYELVKGRPVDETGREAKEIRVYDLLDQLGIEYERIDHERTDTMEACEAVDKSLNADTCKNLFLCNRQKTDFYLLMMPGDKKFLTKNLSKQLGVARLSFAGEEEMEKYLDITPGSVSVMGLMNDTENHVRLLVDTDLLTGEYFGCHPCVNTVSLRVKTKEVLEIFAKAVHHEVTYVTLAEE